MKLSREQSGFSAIEVIIVIIILTIVGFAGYRVVSNDGEETQETENVEIQPATQEAGPITDKEDLNNSVEELQSIDLDTQNEEKELEDLVN